MPNNSSSDRSVLEQAIAAHRGGRLAEAETLYRRFLDGVPDDAGANHNLGILLAQKGRPDEGLPHSQRATELAPHQVHHWISYAEMLCATGRPADAQGILEAAKKRGLRDQALEQAMARIAGARPSPAAGLLTDAIRLHQTGQFEQAAKAYRKVLALQPGLAEVHCNLGSALEARGDSEQAKAAFEQALVLAPNLASAHFNLGNLYRKQKQWDAAAACYRQAVKNDPRFAPGHNNLGLVLLELGRPADAITCFREAVALKVPFASAYANLGSALRLAKRDDEAVAAFEMALQQDPNCAEAHNGLGMALSDREIYREAERHFRRALDLQPGYAEAHGNLGNLLSAIGDDASLNEAIAHYQRALELDPDSPATYNHLGVALCKSHRLAEAFSCFTKGAFRQRLPSALSPHKSRHDQEQLAYRARLGLKPAAELDLRGGEALAGPAVNPNASGGSQERWLSSRPQIVTIDDFLTEEALAGLRRFCLESTIWSESFEDGYLGARPESGFASPLLAQIAEELRANYPAIFRDYPLLYAWSFKYDNRMKGTKIHADFAAVNVNFWITPTEASLDRERGGLQVWDVAAPLDWDFERYNRDEPSIRAYLREKQSKALRIPYRANRAVIFDSDLFHETDDMRFADGYENRRINITLLYGDRKTAAG